MRLHEHLIENKSGTFDNLCGIGMTKEVHDSVSRAVDAETFEGGIWEAYYSLSVAMDEELIYGYPARST